MAFSLTHTDNSVSTTNAATYNFTSQALGAAPTGGETRYTPVAAHVAYNEAGPLTITAIAGVTPTSVTVVSGTGPEVRLSIALTPTGTTGTVSVSIGETRAGCGIDVYRLIDPASATAFATTTDNTPSSGVLDLSLNVPTGGGVIAAVQTDVGGTTTWVGVTENSDIDITGDTGNNMSGASGTTAGTPRTITATNSDTTPNAYAGLAASWAPQPLATVSRMVPQGPSGVMIGGFFG